MQSALNRDGSRSPYESGCNSKENIEKRTTGTVSSERDGMAAISLIEKLHNWH
jgi:hypothetical protein